VSFPPWHGRNCPHHLPVVAVAPAQRWLEEPGVLFFSAGAARARMAALASTAATENPPPPITVFDPQTAAQTPLPGGLRPVSSPALAIARKSLPATPLAALYPALSLSRLPRALWCAASLFCSFPTTTLSSARLFTVYQCRLENGPSYQVQPLCCKPSWMKAAITAAVIAPPTGCRSF